MTEFIVRFFKEKYLSIKWKLVLPLALTILLLLLLLSPLTNRFVKVRIEEEADRRLTEIASSVGKLFENSEYLAITSASLVSSLPESSGIMGSLSTYSPTFTERRNNLQLDELSVYKSGYRAGDQAYFYGGPQVARRLQVSEDATAIRDFLILKALGNGEAYSGIAIAPQGSQIIGVAPIFNTTSQPVGVILASFYMDQEYLDGISAIIGADIAIVKDNKSVVSTIDTKSGYEQLINTGWLQTDESPSTTIVYESGKQYRLAGHHLVVSGVDQGFVLVAQPIDQLFSVTDSIQTVIYILIGVFGVTALWFWVAAFVAFSRPLEQLSEATRKMSGGELNQQVDTSYLVLKDEITQLSEHFNRMATDLNSLYTGLEKRVEERTHEVVEERNKLELALQELAKARDEAVNANRSKSEFVSIVSHELKVPMTSIKGYSDLLIAGAMGPLTDAQLNFLKTVRSNVNRMSTLVSDLADISRIETGNLRLEPGILDVKENLEEVINLSKAQIEQKKQTLKIEVAQDLPKIWADRNRFSQIVVNLVSNANKYTQDEGTITVGATLYDNDNILIKVQDNGYGMTAEDQEKLFTKFFRSSDQEIRNAPGTGLGLNITKNLIELQKGKMWFESEFRAGTTFFFTVPIATIPI